MEKKMKLSLFAGKMIVHIESAKSYTKTLPELKDMFSKV